MRVLYVILVLCTAAVVGVAIGIWRLIQRRMREHHDEKHDIDEKHDSDEKPGINEK